MHAKPGRILAIPLLALALVGAACGNTTPGATGSATTAPGATAGATMGGGGGADQLAGLVPADALATIFGGVPPAPQCQDSALGEMSSCRWTSSDGKTVVDVQADRSYDDVAAWRAAFGQAGFSTELPGVGEAALSGDNPLSGGVRAATFVRGTSFSITITSDADKAALLAAATAVLTRLAAG